MPVSRITTKCHIHIFFCNRWSSIINYFYSIAPFRGTRRTYFGRIVSVFFFFLLLLNAMFWLQMCQKLLLYQSLNVVDVQKGFFWNPFKGVSWKSVRLCFTFFWLNFIKPELEWPDILTYFWLADTAGRHMVKKITEQPNRWPHFKMLGRTSSYFKHSPFFKTLNWIYF